MDRHHPIRRRLVLASTLAVAAWSGLLVGCGSDGERATTTTTTTEPPTPRDLARRACTDVLEERSEEVSRRATDAAAVLQEALEAPEEPPDQVFADVQDALGAERGQLADAQATLRAVELPSADRPAWTTVVDAVDPVLADVDGILAFLRSPDWDRRPDTVRIGAPTPDRVALHEALDGLDLLGTDCQWVYDYPGDPADAAPFHHDAAAACSMAVERRRTTGFDPSSATDADGRAEWAETADELVTVDHGTLDDPAAWERLVSDARDRAGGDAGGGAMSEVVDDLEFLGLDQRPCAALWPAAADG